MNWSSDYTVAGTLSAEKWGVLCGSKIRGSSKSGSFSEEVKRDKKKIFRNCLKNPKTNSILPCLPTLPKGPTMHWQQLLAPGEWLLFLDQAKNQRMSQTFRYIILAKHLQQVEIIATFVSIFQPESS